MKRRIHLIIKGRVQGVCFRMYTCEEAERLGLTGWVRNNADGTVEVLAEGDEKLLLELAEWCRHGPPHAMVSEVISNYSGTTCEFDGFSVTG